MYKKDDKLRIYYDAEFTGLNRKTGLISIGLVSDSGTTFYAEFTDFDEGQVSEWINNNVIRNLTIEDDADDSLMVGHKVAKAEGSSLYHVEVKGHTKLIKKKLLRWLLDEFTIANKQIQFFTDCYAYDWVLMLDLICKFGDGLNIPDYINYIPIDLSTLLWTVGIDPDISREEFAGDFPIPANVKEAKHNSRWDAYVAKVCFEKIEANMIIRHI